MNSPADPPPTAPPRRDRTFIWNVTLFLIGSAAAFYLVKELAALLKPLLLAVFLAYVILPIYLRLRERVPGLVAMAMLVTGTVGILMAVALGVAASANELSNDLKDWTVRIAEFLRHGSGRLREQFPWLAGVPGVSATVEALGESQARAAVGSGITAVLGLAADLLSQAAVVGLYLLFIMLEAPRFPRRVEAAFPGERGGRLLKLIAGINEVMADYLRLRVTASLILAVPFTITLWVFGVRYAPVWGLLAFVCNFIPYLGAFVSTGLAALVAFLQLGFGWPFVVVAAVLVGLQVLMGSLIEPPMTGRAVDLSPLVVLSALAFWGLCWGLIGVLLAVPLTVVLKLVLEHIETTRPFARLLSGD